MVKRKPGRPSQGGRSKSSVFSTRIDPELRRQIEVSAKLYSDGNISNETTRLLKYALASQKKQSLKLRTIAYLMGQIASMIGPEWETDPWSFEAFKHAVSVIFEKLTPTGPLNPSKLGKLVADRRKVAPEQFSPTAFGEDIAKIIWWILITQTTPLPGKDASQNLQADEFRYAMVQAREALKMGWDGFEAFQLFASLSPSPNDIDTNFDLFLVDLSPKKRQEFYQQMLAWDDKDQQRRKEQ